MNVPEQSHEDWVELTQLDDFLTDTTASFEAPSEGSLRYSFLGEVGKGAMGEVLLAQDQHLRRKVAYKQILPQMAQNSEVLRRFFLEAQITAQLDHPAIIPVYNLEVGSQKQLAYSMKLVNGHTFKELLQKARQQFKSEGAPDQDHQLNTLLAHFLKVCDAMYFSHCRGVIHRDLKPANIMVGPYREVYVMDWGIARLMGNHEEPVPEDWVQLFPTDSESSFLEQSEETQMGRILGTPRYLSPEQATGRNAELDGLSDQFTLGLILFEIAALRPAFTAKTQIAMLKRVLKAEKEPLVHIHPKVKVAPELAAIIHKATARKRKHRYKNVKAMADDLRRHMRGEAVLARPDNILQKTMRWMAQHRQLTLLVLSALMLLSMLSAAGFLYQRQQTLIYTREHEQRLSVFLKQVAQQSEALDRQFFLGEMALESLGAVVVEALVRGEPTKEKVYLDTDYAKVPPADFQQVKRYDKQISTSWPVFKLAPQTLISDVKPSLLALNRLRHDLQRLFVRGALSGEPLPTGDKLSQLIRREELPLRWVYVGLKQGVMFAYPGAGGYPKDYDPRLRPWYKKGSQHRDLYWQEPYVDVQGQGWLLPCTQSLYSYTDEFLGVAGAEVALKDIAQYLGKTDQNVHAVYLLDASFNMILKKEAAKPVVQATQKLLPFPYAADLKQVKSVDNGYIVSNNKLLVYNRLDTLGWFYVVEADMGLEGVSHG